MRIEAIVTAEPRASRGKNEARRTRVSGRIPAVIYGAFKDAQSVSVSPKDVLKILRGKSGHNSIFDLDVTGLERTPVIVADEQYDPVKGNLLHVDFKRIDVTKKLRISVPIHITGEAKGVKQQGGMLDAVTRAVELECLPDDIPNDFMVDVSELALHGAIRISDLQVKEGVRVITPQDAVIAHVTGIKEEAVAEPVVAEPELAKKGKKEAAPVAAPGDKDKKEAAPAAKAPAAKKK